MPNGGEKSETKVELFKVHPPSGVVQHLGLKNAKKLLLRDLVFLVLIAASHPMGEVEYLKLSSSVNTGSSGYDL